ncbi:MAG: CRISPR-associated protein Cas5 [Acidobacteria bacterium]|jgi:CRISPR-associated protein Cas5 subtype I-B|nr:CRISPR-associated protein Cas5 [Acidobacteriota bacterium]
MKGVLFELKGNWGHFRKPETNNNPLTHDFITKTALIGLIGAVLGIERWEMAKLFPQLSENLIYGVCVKKAVKKESWAFTLRYVVDLMQKAPKQMEFLKNLENTIALALKDENSVAIFADFVSAIQKNEAKFTPVLGLHNCPAEIEVVSVGEFQMKNGNFATKGFIKEKQFDVGKTLASNKFRIGLEKIPTFQNDDFWNLPDRYEKVLYPSENQEVFANGEFYEFADGSQWTLI